MNTLPGRHCGAARGLIGIGLLASLVVGCDGASGRGAAPTSRPTTSEHSDGHASDGPADDAHEGDHADEIHLSEEAVRTFGVKVGRVEARALEAAVAAPARVAFNAEAMAHVGSLVSGRVREIKVRLGDVVKPGDELLVIESIELGAIQSEYLSKLAAVEASRPAVALLRDAYQRAQKLFDEAEAITLTDVQKRQSELRTAERELAVAEADAAAAGNKLRLHGMTDAQLEALAKSKKVDPTYRVSAPIGGAVIEREVTPGELVSPSDEALLVLADLSKVWVLADVPEARLGQVGVGSIATIQPPAAIRAGPTATDSAGASTTHPSAPHTAPSAPGARPSASAALRGVVTYVDPRVDEHTRTARLRVEVDNTGGALRPGMFARAYLVPPAADSAAGSPSVPAGAVMEVEGEPSVFVPVEGEPNTFVRRAVTVGERVGDFVPIISGLAVGDPVVVGGAFILKAEIGKSGVAHEH